MAFIISGRDHGRFVSMSRERPAAAGLLAGSWLEQGYTDVQIEWDGRSFTLTGFRNQFVLIAKGVKPRRALRCAGELAT